MRRVLFPILLLLCGVAHSAGFHPVEDIRAAAEAAAAGNGADRAEATVDGALRLPQCPTPLQATMGAAGTVEVGCIDAGWRLYVPVRVQRLQSVYVLTRPVSAQQPISADAVRVEQRDVSRMPGGALVAGVALDGRIARRALMAGSVLLEQDALPPRAVKRGDPVTLLSRAGGIEVRAAGRALAAAGIAERVAVENVGSRRVVQGIVLASGEVEVLR